MKGMEGKKRPWKGERHEGTKAQKLRFVSPPLLSTPPLAWKVVKDAEGCRRTQRHKKLDCCVPTTVWVQKVQTSFITACRVEVSPPHAGGATTPSTFKESQMAFTGPHHVPKIWGKSRNQSYSNEPRKGLAAKYHDINDQQEIYFRGSRILI